MKSERVEIYARILWSIECGRCRVDNIFSSMQVDKKEFVESIKDLLHAGIIEEDVKPASLGGYPIKIFNYRINYFNYMIFCALKQRPVCTNQIFESV